MFQRRSLSCLKPTASTTTSRWTVPAAVSRRASSRARTQSSPRPRARPSRTSWHSCLTTTPQYQVRRCRTLFSFQLQYSRRHCHLPLPGERRPGDHRPQDREARVPGGAEVRVGRGRGRAQPRQNEAEQDAGGPLHAAQEEEWEVCDDYRGLVSSAGRAGG